MPRVTANNIELEYDEHGSKDAPPLLLIMGLGAQMTMWPIELVEALASRGFRVIRFDNRDIGLSQKLDGAKAPGLMRHMLMRRFGLRPKVPYSLADMADDAAGLLDALGIDKAHIVGGSMGGMIAQLVAANHPQKVLSLTSIFSTTGSPKLPAADRAAMKALTTAPASMEEEALIEHGIMISHAIGSPGYRPDPEWQRERVTQHVRRSFYREGMLRQMAAIVDDWDRTKRLAAIAAPTLVLHGEDDPLVKVEGGHATAAAIPGAQIKTISGWGHDLPIELVDQIADAIAAHAKGAALAA